MMRYFIYFFFVSIVLGISICILFAHLACAWSATPSSQKKNKWRTGIAIVLWIAAAVMAFSTTMGCLAGKVFTDTTFQERYEQRATLDDAAQRELFVDNSIRLGMISSLNIMFIFIALGLYTYRFRSSDSTLLVKASKVLGYGLLFCLYFYYVSILFYITQLFT